LSGSEPVKGIDLGFGLHAGCGMVWLVCAYIQIVHTRRMGRRAHKIFGYISMLAFLSHVGASCFTLYTDVVRHKTLPRMLLIGSSFSSVNYMVQAMCLTRKRPQGWVTKHKDLIFLCFIYSIQGAGTIRAIAQVQMWLHCGPVVCQAAHGGMATECMWAYTFRMFWISVYTMYIRAIYVKLSKDTDLTVDFLRDLRSSCVAWIGLLAFSWVPYSETILDFLLGAERTIRGTCAVFLFGATKLYFDLKESF